MNALGCFGQRADESEGLKFAIKKKLKIEINFRKEEEDDEEEEERKQFSGDFLA